MLGCAILHAQLFHYFFYSCADHVLGIVIFIRFYLFLQLSQSCANLGIFVRLTFLRHTYCFISTMSPQMYGNSTRNVWQSKSMRGKNLLDIFYGLRAHIDIYYCLLLCYFPTVNFEFVSDSFGLNECWINYFRQKLIMGVSIFCKFFIFRRRR